MQRQLVSRSLNPTLDFKFAFWLEEDHYCGKWGREKAKVGLVMMKEKKRIAMGKSHKTWCELWVPCFFLCTHFVCFRGQFGQERLHLTVGGSLIEKFDTFMCAVWGGDPSLALCWPIIIIVIFSPLVNLFVYLHLFHEARPNSINQVSGSGIYAYPWLKCWMLGAFITIKACQVSQLPFE